MGLHTQTNMQGWRGHFNKLLIRNVWGGNINCESLSEFRWQDCADTLSVESSANRHINTVSCILWRNVEEVCCPLCVCVCVCVLKKSYKKSHSQHVMSRKVSFATIVTHALNAWLLETKILQETQGRMRPNVWVLFDGQVWLSFLNALLFRMHSAMTPLWMCCSVWQVFGSFQCTNLPCAEDKQTLKTNTNRLRQTSRMPAGFKEHVQNECVIGCVGVRVMEWQRAVTNSLKKKGERRHGQGMWWVW